MQENNKPNILSIVGMVIMSALMFWYISKSDSGKKDNITPTKTQTNLSDSLDSKEVSQLSEAIPNTLSEIVKQDSLQKDTSLVSDLSKNSIQNQEFTLENDQLKVVLSTKGGGVSSLNLKEFKSYKDYKDKVEDAQLDFINSENGKFELEFETNSGQTINTSTQNFIPKVIEEGKAVSMTLKASDNQYLEYVYRLDTSKYMLSFEIRSKGMNRIWKKESPKFLWELKSLAREKSVSVEEQNAEIYHTYETEEVDYKGSATNEVEEKVTWIAFRQHLFTSTLISEKLLPKVDFSIQKNKDSLYVKNYKAISPLTTDSNGEIDYKFRWYNGPNDYEILKSHDIGLQRQVQFGPKIFRWVNLYFIYPVFKTLHGWGLKYGLIIFMMTIVIKIILSPVTFRQYFQSAKMRVIRPELDELNEKNKDKDPLKKQQATMALYKKAGINPMAGCLPALLQMPILYALFRFFPALIDLRQEHFLWADDLSGYDSILKLPFSIPFYGDHVSLFTLLMAVSLFFYTRMSGTQMPQTRQEGMPDMKFIFYLMPVFMIFFFNNYSSGLTYYYFIANFTTIILVLVIKKFFINEEKILAKIEENKKKPVKQSKFQKKMQDIMKQAEEQQKRNKRK